MKRIGINGLGRIGRLCLRTLLDRGHTVAAVNDPNEKEVIAYLLNYDSSHGRWRKNVQHTPKGLRIADEELLFFHERNASDIPWEEASVDLVVECSGAFGTREAVSLHLKRGAKRVILSAPAKSKDIPTVVMGVNDEVLTGREPIVSNASCTTNCLAVMAKVLDAKFSLKEGYISTVHAYTSDQRLLDKGHKDLRRARAAATSIIPTSTGAAEAIGLVLPHLAGKLDGLSMRVPVPDGSLTDLVALVRHRVPDPETLNQAFGAAASGSLKGVLAYTEAPIVSVDIVGNPNSCIFDASLTRVRGKMVKIVGWYDNEMGYTHRLVDLVERLQTLMKKGN